MLIIQYFISFLVCSFLGWLWESIFSSLKKKHFENRGFLYGPICPIYGSGAVIGFIVFTYIPILSDDPPLWEIFFISALGSAILEYLTSYLMEKLFHARWWDYSNVFCNINGRICLPATLAFGASGILIIKCLLPLFDSFWAGTSFVIDEILALLLAILLGMDIAFTFDSLKQFNLKIDKLQSDFYERGEEHLEDIQASIEEMNARRKLREKEMSRRIRETAESMSSRQRNILANISRASTENRQSITSRLKESVENIRQEYRRHKEEEKNSGKGTK